MSVVFKKKSYPSGSVRDYGEYGKYIKGEDGKWKRLKKSYPLFRRTLVFKNMKEFLLQKGIQEKEIEKRNSKGLRNLIRISNMGKDFNTWLKNKEK